MRFAAGPLACSTKRHEILCTSEIQNDNIPSVRATEVLFEIRFDNLRFQIRTMLRNDNAADVNEAFNGEFCLRPAIIAFSQAAVHKSVVGLPPCDHGSDWRSEGRPNVF